MMIELSETALFRQGILAQEPFGNTTGWFGAMCRAVHFKNLGLHRTRTNKTEKNIEPTRTERCVDPWFRRLLSYENALSSAVIKKSYLAKRKLKWNVNVQGTDFLFTTEVQTAKRMGGPSDLIRCENQKAPYVM